MEQILINYTKTNDSYILAIKGNDFSKVVTNKDSKSEEFINKLQQLINEVYG